jgi:hypothetical protein
MVQFDPNTAFGSVAINVIAAVIVAALLAMFAWVGGPLKWTVRGRHLRRLLLSGRQFIFVFNPLTGGAKIVTFEANGQIGKGHNPNEHSWRIRRGALEIFAADGEIYSRFVHDKGMGLLKHTNDPDTRSIHGQYFQPDFLHWAKAADQAAEDFGSPLDRASRRQVGKAYETTARHFE